MDRIALIQQMIEEDNADPFLHYALALEYQKAGRTDETLTKLQEVQSSFPEYLPVYYLLGKALEGKGDWKMALDAYQQGLKLAQANGERKTAGELSEAIMIAEDVLEDQGEI